MDNTNNGSNYQLYEEYAVNRCSGVPFLIHAETKEFVCGYLPTDGLHQFITAQQK